MPQGGECLKAVEASGAHTDPALLEQAQQVMKLVQPQQFAQGKYNIQIGQAYGTVIGENNTVNQQFSK